MMSIEELMPHLLELRKRLLRSTLLAVFFFTLFFFFADDLLTWLGQRTGHELIAIEVISPFTIPLKLAMGLAALFGIPYCLLELWGFLSPALYEHEKKNTRLIIGLSLVLFYVGVGFALLVVCPAALAFFKATAPAGVTVLTDIRPFLDFHLTLSLAFGLAFQCPLIVWGILSCQWVSLTQLKQARPFYIVGAFIIGMILTPPDVVSQCLLAIPLWGLFELGILCYQWQVKRRNLAPHTL